VPGAEERVRGSEPSEGSATQLERWLGVIFFLSGISGLMYEVVWVRMLTRMLGSTVYATSTVLSGFMAGLALGSFLIGRILDRSRRLLVLYAVLEFGIAISALLSLLLPNRLVPLYQHLYEVAGESRGWLTAAQILISLAVLLIPTTLMGATMPTLCSFGVRAHRGVGHSVGTFYALNTFGGVVGVLASGFVLLGAVGERRTVAIGVIINVLAGVGTLILQRLARNLPGVPPDEPGPAPAPSPASATAGASGLEVEVIARESYSSGVGYVVLLCFAVSGFAALAGEVVWSRLLTLHQGTSIYAFSAMLGVMLSGMGVGSFVVGRSIDRWPDSLRTLARLELGLGLAAAFALHIFNWMGVPNRPDLTSSYEARIAYLLFVPLVLIGPIGFLSGAMFPVAARCYARSQANSGRRISELYAWNTVGCLVGPLVAGFWLIPTFGAGFTASLIASISLVLGLLLLVVHPAGVPSWRRLEWVGCGIAGVLLVTAGDPYLRHIERRVELTTNRPAQLYRHIEEANGTTTAFSRSETDPMDKALWVNGTGMTVLAVETKLMAHLPISLAQDPHDVLVVCFGMGTTLRSASRHENLNIWVVEMIPGVLQCFGYFHPDGPALLDRPNIHAVADDGRNFLLVRPQQYDVITIDPAPPLYSAGTVNLYTREFFELCRARLRPGGVMCLWIPPANHSEVKMILRTYLDVFPHTGIWSGVKYQGLYAIGSLQPFRDVDAKVSELFEHPAIVRDLTEWGDSCNTPKKVLGLYIADGDDLRGLLAQTPVITDDRPYTEFPLWRAFYGGTTYSRLMDGSSLRAILRRPPSK
jgi:spermidine synthase